MPQLPCHPRKAVVAFGSANGLTTPTSEFLSIAFKAVPSLALWLTCGRYGLGYQLSDGSVGVLFNDGTKMVLAPDDM